MKNSIYPFGVNALTQLIAWFPGIVGQLIMMWVVSKATIVMSNVPGPKKCLHWPEFKVKATGFIAAMCIATSLAAVSSPSNSTITPIRVPCR